MKVEVDVLGSPSLIILTVSVDVKQHSTKTRKYRAQELCESRGGRSGLPVPFSPYGLCGLKASSYFFLFSFFFLQIFSRLLVLPESSDKNIEKQIRNCQTDAVMSSVIMQ